MSSQTSNYLCCPCLAYLSLSHNYYGSVCEVPLLRPKLNTCTCVQIKSQIRQGAWKTKCKQYRYLWRGPRRRRRHRRSNHCLFRQLNSPLVQLQHTCIIHFHIIIRNLHYYISSTPLKLLTPSKPSTKKAVPWKYTKYLFTFETIRKSYNQNPCKRNDCRYPFIFFGFKHWTATISSTCTCTSD